MNPLRASKNDTAQAQVFEHGAQEHPIAACPE